MLGIIELHAMMADIVCMRCCIMTRDLLYMQLLNFLNHMIASGYKYLSRALLCYLQLHAPLKCNQYCSMEWARLCSLATQCTLYIVHVHVSRYTCLQVVVSACVCAGLFITCTCWLMIVYVLKHTKAHEWWTVVQLWGGGQELRCLVLAWSEEKCPCQGNLVM